MKADLCTDSYGGESANRFDLYLVVHPRAERGDEVRVGGVEGCAAWDVGEEVPVNELVLWAPNLPSLFVEDGVEVWVSRRWVSTRWSSEEVGEEVDVGRIGVVGGGRRLYGGGGDRGWVVERRGWAPNDIFGRRETCG